MLVVIIVSIIFGLIPLCGVVYLFVLIVKALKKYISSGEIRKEKSNIKKTLGETLKDHRTNCKMTQEFGRRLRNEKDYVLVVCDISNCICH